MASRQNARIASERPGGVLAAVSLEHKVPLVIGALLLAVIVVVCIAAYVEVRRAVLRTASQRLDTVSDEFRSLFQQNGVQLRAVTARAASDSTLVAYARSRDSRLRERTLGLLRGNRAASDPVLAVELRDDTGAVLLSSTPRSFGSDTTMRRQIANATSAGDSAFVGQFDVVNDTLVYPVVARIPGGNGAMLVQWRRLTGSRRDRGELTRLVGSDATLMIGNASGGPWTNLERIVPRPTFDDAGPTPKGASYREMVRDDGTSVLRNIGPVPGMPWAVAVDFPTRSTLAPVASFSNRLILLATAALALGLIAGWMISRRITRPLRDLTAAADAIAGGNYGARVEIHRSDELGRLGRAFGTMAGEIAHARETLEHRVDERTRDLNQTLKQLEDAQETLLRREKLALLGQLASGVGHELRNPLGVMTNAVYYLKMVLAASPAEVLEYLEILQQQITLSEKIVSDLLDFARAKPPQRSPTDVGGLVKAQLARMGTMADVRVHNELPESLPPVLVDQVQMGQIVLNVLTNGVQAVEGSGSLTIRGDRNGDHVSIEFADSGPGVDAANIEKIFEPLFTTKARGIGLGLAVSRTLARANGGDLTVKSPPGSGATFRLTLPIAGAPAA